MKTTNIVYAFFIIVAISFVFYFSRQIFNFRYEPEYYENWYYHSQWNIPNSTRGIGDGDLYKFIGYRLAEGENPFDLNFEVPPFGKLLFGLTEKYTGNPYWVNIILYLLSIGVFGLLTKDLFKQNSKVLPATLLFVTTPLVATQLKDTMLDLPLMFLLLVHTLFFVKYLSGQNIKYLIISGIFLGLFTGTKIGVYTPLIGIFGATLVLILSKKKFLFFLFYFLSVIAGYLFAYISYFIKHPNPIPWLRLHEKPIEFYMNSSIAVDHFNQWKTIFFNTYQGWWNPGQIIRLEDWSFVIPLGTIATFIVLGLTIKKQKTEWIYLCGLTVIFLLVNSFLLFWPRYLIPVIPFFVLFIAYISDKYKLILLFLILLNIPIFYKVLNKDTLPDTVQNISSSISTRAYRGLYRSIVAPAMSEDDFINQNVLIWDKLEVKNIEMKVTEISQTNNIANIKYQLKYYTKYGTIIENPTLIFILTNNQWKLNWQWNYLLENYQPDSKIIIQKEKISKNDNTKSMVPVYIVPRLMGPTWNESLSSLAAVTGQNNNDVDKQIKNVIPDKYPQFVGYLKPDLSTTTLELSKKINGASLGIPDNYFTFPNGKFSGYYVKANLYLEDNQGKKTLIPLQISNQ